MYQSRPYLNTTPQSFLIQTEHAYPRTRSTTCTGIITIVRSVPFPSSSTPSTPPSSQNQGNAAVGKSVAAADSPGAEDGEDLSQGTPVTPQMSSARARDGGRMQRGGVEGVIAPFEPGVVPGHERPEPEPRPEPNRNKPRSQLKKNMRPNVLR